MKKLFLCIALLSPFGAFAQNPGDTIVVQTLTYSSQTRDTAVYFPDLPGVTYEKILMRYNMRCKNGLVSPPISGQTNIGCGEWDYSCNTSIIDSSRVDSVLNFTNSHTISGFSGTTYNYSTAPTFTYTQFDQQDVNATVVSEMGYLLGGGSNSLSHVLATDANSTKSQYLYTAAELNTAGVTAGNIDAFDFYAPDGGTAGFLRVRIKGTSKTALDPTDVDVTGFTEVYFNNTTIVSTAVNRLQFYQPFVWNGTDNIIVEFSNTNAVPSTTATMEGQSSGMDYGLYSADNYYLTANGGQGIDLDAAPMNTISNEITISFWSFGDASLPVNTTIFEGVDANNARQVNVHLPWSNGQVYWDCGNDGSGYDRINLAANAADFAGKWSHWAFTKNATSGEMRIYLNGTLFHSGTGLTKPIDIQEFELLKNYYGHMDEFRVWDTELSQATIQDWMNRTVDATHPNYSNLVTYHQFDEGTGTATQEVVSGNNATVPASLAWLSDRGKDIDKFFTLTQERPALTFQQGTYTLNVTPVTVLDSVQNPANFVEENAISPNYGTAIDDDIVVVSSNSYWEAVDQIIYDENGTQIGTIPVTQDGSITITELEYFRRFPSKFEIMSFVTPYGINLDLGPTGKTWYFDLTDFTPILQGDKRLLMDRGGQWQEEMDISFLFIVGTPPRDVIDMQQIWRVDSRGYTNIIDDRSFEPRDVATNANGEYFKVRSAITGHGQEGEFIPRQHYIDVEGGNDEFVWDVWKACPENPVYPQGGTWIYDRAGWCPGMATDVQESDITQYVTPGQPINIDYGLYTAAGTSNYIVNNQLVTYGAINHTVDAAVVDVIAPSTRVEYARLNSICNEPSIHIKNTGSDNLTSLTIKYWVNNDQPKVFNWTGDLAFGEMEAVTLPNTWTLWDNVTATGNTFHVEIEAPNGGADEYSFNNTYTQAFDVPAVVPGHFFVWFATNAAGAESSYELLDDQDNVIFSRSNMANNTQYRDTFQLGFGCYKLRFEDSDNDGISFFANNDGNGFIRLREVGGGTIEQFNPDYGAGFEYNFTIDYALTLADKDHHRSVEVYPNPTRDDLRIEGDGFGDGTTIKVYNSIGELVYSSNANTEDFYFTHNIDMTQFENGIYVVVVENEETRNVTRVVKQ